MSETPPVLTNTLDLEVSVDGSCARLALRGALSVRSVDLLSRQLVRLAQAGVEELELDMAGLTRLDFHGVAMLLRVQHQSPDEGWQVTMVAPPEHLRHQLSRMGVASRLRFAGV